MPSVYDLKPKFQSLLRPLVSSMAKRGVTANQITVFAAILSMVGGACIAVWPGERGPLLLLPGILLIRMALNAVDGMLAREFNQKTRLGAILNELGDVISDAALYLPLACVPQVNSWAVVIMVISAILVEYVGVVAIQVDAQRRYDGPMGKSDRAFWIGLLATLLALEWLSPFGMTIGMIVLTIFGGLTVINRARQALISQADN